MEIKVDAIKSTGKELLKKVIEVIKHPNLKVDVTLKEAAILMCIQLIFSIMTFAFVVIGMIKEVTVYADLLNVSVVSCMMYGGFFILLIYVLFVIFKIINKEKFKIDVYIKEISVKFIFPSILLFVASIVGCFYKPMLVMGISLLAVLVIISLELISVFKEKNYYLMVIVVVIVCVLILGIYTYSISRIVVDSTFTVSGIEIGLSGLMR